MEIFLRINWVPEAPVDLKESNCDGGRKIPVELVKERVSSVGMEVASTNQISKN